jgi:hypothetical protein
LFEPEREHTPQLREQKNNQGVDWACLFYSLVSEVKKVIFFRASAAPHNCFFCVLKNGNTISCFLGYFDISTNKKNKK